jgi:hypothetical protein
VKNKKNKKRKRKRKREKNKEKEYEGGSNILTHRFLFRTRGNAQGIEEYKGITV